MAAREDILEKVRKSRQEAERRIQQNNQRSAQEQAASRKNYENSVSAETRSEASYMGKYSSSSRAGSTVADYAEKRRKLTNWYKGDTPSAAETLARITQIGQTDDAKGRAAYDLFEQERATPGSPFYNPYDAATSQKQTKTTLANTQKAMSEWAALADELTYWAGRTDLNLSDDDILARVDWDNYKTLQKMDEGRTSGSPLELLAPVGYSEDAMRGVLWAARNPESSTGDAMMDAVQSAMGRGKAYVRDDIRAAQLDPSSQSYNPYAVSGTMLDLERKYGTAGFDADWLEQNMGMRGSTDYAKVYNAEQFTAEAEAELEEFNRILEEELTARPTQDVDKLVSYLFDEGNFKALAKLDESLKSGKLLDTTRAIHYDRQAIEQGVREYVALSQARANAPKDPEAMAASVEAEKAAVVKEKGMLSEKDTIPQSRTNKTETVFDIDVSKAFQDALVWAGTSMPHRSKSGDLKAWENRYDYVENAKDNQELSAPNRLIGRYADWTDEQKEAGQDYIYASRGGYTVDNEVLALKEAGLTDEQVNSFRSEVSEALASADYTDDHSYAWFDPTEEVPAKNVAEERNTTRDLQLLIESGNYEEAAKVQYNAVSRMLESSDEEAALEVLHSVDSQKSAATLLSLAINGGMMGKVNDPQVKEQLRIYEKYAKEALAIEDEPLNGFIEKLDSLLNMNGALVKAQNNDGLGLNTTLQLIFDSTMTRGAQFVDDLIGSALIAVGSAVGSEKLTTTGESIATDMDSTAAHYQQLVRDNGTPLEIMAVQYGSEIAHQLQLGSVASGLMQFSNAKLGESLKFLQRMISAAPFAAEAGAGEFFETYEETKDPLLSAGTGLAGYAVTSLMSQWDGLLRNIEANGMPYIPEVVEKLSSVPGSGALAGATRWGKGFLMWLGNLGKTAVNEAVQEPAENVATTFVTDIIKGKNPLDRDWGEYGRELIAEGVGAAILSLGSSVSTMPTYARSVIVAESQLGKSELNASDVQAFVDALKQDMSDPQIVEEAQRRATDIAVEARTGELMAQGALAEADNSQVAEKEKAAAEASEAAAQATAEKEAAYEKVSANPADDSATSEMLAAIKKEDEAIKTAQAAQAELEEVQASVQAQSDAVMGAARAQAEAEVEAAVSVARDERAAANEVQRESDNAAVIDADNFISTQLKGYNLTDEDRQRVTEMIRSRTPLKGADNREGSGSRVKFITGMQKKFGVKITVRDTTEGGQYLRYNGMYDPKTDSIVIDSKATQSDVIYGVLLHELTHKAERSEVYGEFAKSILALKYGEDTQKLEADIRAKQLSYDARLKKMAERDASVDATPLTRDQAQREIVADLTREILYGDEVSIQKLCAEQPSVAQRILEAIRNFIDRLRGVNDPAVDQLNKTRDLFEKALGQSAEMKPGETRSFPTDGIQYSLREEPDPVNTIKGYKVFVVFDNKPGELYPPMVANPGGDSTPVGVWLNADAAPRGADSKTGRAQVQAGGKGTQASKMSLAYRPGWHLGDLPMATQFLRKNPETGKKELFPANFVWAECECAADHDYQEEAMSYGYTKNGKFQHSLAGLPRLPREEDGTAGYYRYRTNPNPDTVPWIITGAMKVTRILDDAETDAILRDAGVEPIPRQGGPIDLEKYGLAAGNVENYDRVQYQIADDEPLLSKAEYARLKSNWNSQKTGTQFQNRPGGGKLIAMDNLLVYTDKKGEPEHVVEINQDDLWIQNDIQQDLVLMEQEGFDLETQRIVLEGSYGTGSAYFRDRGAVSESARENRAGAGRNARAVRKGNYVEVSYEGEEVSDGRAKYSLPSDDILSEMVDSYLSQRTETEQPKRPQGERQFVRQTMPNTEAVPEWIWREFQQNPDELNYDIDSNRAQVERGWQRIQENGYEAELDRLMETDTFNKDDTAQANLMMAMALREDDPATFMALASKYNKEGTKAGQTLQARKLFTRMSPTGARIWVAGKLENTLGEYIRKHRPVKQKVDQRAKQVADSIRELDNTDLMKRLTAGEEVTLDSQNNRFGVPINAQQQALIDQYQLNDVARPGIFYNRATLKQRMLEAILATPNPLGVTGNGLNLIQRLEYMKEGAAVITNADLNYIGSMLSEFVARGGDEGGREADVAVARAYEAFGNVTPTTVGENIRTWRYMAMLTSVPSAIRNVIGNTTQNVVNATAHGIAVELDKIVAKHTGARTAEHLSVRERVAGWNGFVEETKNTFRDYFVDKVTTQRGEAKYSTNQRGRVYQSQMIETVRNVEGFLMSFGDRNVWRKAYLNSMAEQQKLADQNLLFNDDGTTRTHEQMLEQAEFDANYATFTEDNRVSKILSQLKREPGIGTVVDLVMPFTGVPANITRRMIQYSPIGLATSLAKSAYDAAKGQNFDQQAFVNGVSRGLTGTALFGVGMLLAQMGVIKMGTGEEEDAKKYGLQTAMGQQYSPFIYNPLKDEYVSLSVFSPSASALTMGGAAWMDFQNDEDAIQALQNAAFGSIDQIFDASYMSGLSDLFGGYGSFGENLRDTLLSSAISQNVPAILSQLANTVDPYVRNTKDKNSLMQALKSGLINKIPFLRQQLLPEKVDVTGQTFRTKEGLRNFYDPFTTTDARQEPVVDELFRLSEALGSSSMLPSDALSGTKNSITLNKQTVVLDGEGKEAYQKRYGELWLEGGVTIDKKGKRKTVEGVRELMASVRYQRMSDEEKADAIADILSAAMTGAKMEAIQKYGADAEKE